MCFLSRTVIVLLVAFLIGCQSTGGGGDAKTSADGASAAGADVRTAVLELHEQHRKALLNKDAATLDRLWTDDFIFINYRGQMLTKAQRLENVRTGATAFKSIQFTDESVRSYGDSTVLIGVVTLDGQYSGTEGGGTYRFSSVCSRRGGRWQIAVLQMTRVEQ